MSKANGGLLQLVAYGKKEFNAIQSSNFEFCKHKCSYDTFEIKSDETENGNKSFKLKRDGDLVHKVYIKIKHKQLESNLEYLMIDEIKLFVNRKLIDQHTGQWLYIQTELTKEYKSLYDSESGVYYIPLQFAFNKHVELSLPIFFMDIEIQVKMNKNFNYSDISLSADYIYLDMRERRLLKDLYCSKNGVYFNVEKLYYSVTEYNKSETDNVNVDPPKSQTQELFWVICDNKSNDFMSIKKAKIMLNNSDRNNYESDFYYNKLLPQKYYNNVPSPGIYMYKFTPSNDCTSSYMDFPRIATSKLCIQLQETKSNITVYCYTRTYDTLKLQSEME
jgi:hypothetical protein